MFWRRKSEPPSATLAEQIPEGPSLPVATLLADPGALVLPSESEEERILFAMEYQNVACKLDVAVKVPCSARGNGSLRRTLYAEGIPIYPLDAVASWLQAHVSEGETWGWFPLRNTDYVFMLEGNRRGLASQNGSLRRAQYEKPVPLPVLLTVDRLTTQLPGDLRFFVSDTAKYQDPFLAVMERASMQEFYIIERWDEPGFRR